MNVQEDSKVIAQGIRSMRFFLGALLAGLLLFLAVAVSTKWNSQPRPEEDHTVVLLVFLGQAAIFAVFGQLLSSRGLDKQRKELAASLGNSPRAEDIPADKLLQMLQGTRIVRLAILEAASFALLICLIVTGKFWLLAVVAVLMALMVREWPTVAGVTGWIEEQRDRIRQDF